MSHHVILNEWLYPFIVRIFYYPPKWCTDSTLWLLHGWYHVKLLPSQSAQVLPRTPFKPMIAALVYGVTSFKVTSPLSFFHYFVIWHLFFFLSFFDILFLLLSFGVRYLFFFFLSSSSFFLLQSFCQYSSFGISFLLSSSTSQTVIGRARSNSGKVSLWYRPLT